MIVTSDFTSHNDKWYTMMSWQITHNIYRVNCVINWIDCMRICIFTMKWYVFVQWYDNKMLIQYFHILWKWQNATSTNKANFFLCSALPLYCQNPTNNPKQLKTTFVGVVLLSVRKTTTPRHHHHTTTTRVSLQLEQF